MILRDEQLQTEREERKEGKLNLFCQQRPNCHRISVGGRGKPLDELSFYDEPKGNHVLSRIAVSEPMILEGGQKGQIWPTERHHCNAMSYYIHLIRPNQAKNVENLARNGAEMLRRIMKAKI